MRIIAAVLPWLWLLLAPCVARAQYDPYPPAYAVGEPVAEQYQYGYVGPHPEPYDYGSAPCYQQGVHFHPYPPFDQYLFRESGGYFYFVGDLGDFGYSGQLWGYQGNHPIPVELGGGFCYMDWPHRHHYPAPPSLPFRYVGGYYTYYGAWDPAYYTYRDAWLGYYNGYYRSSYFGGRYFTVRPPHVYRPVYGWGSRGVYRPGMTVYGPGGGSITVGPIHRPYPGYVAAPPRPGYVGPPPSGGYVSPPSRGYVAPPPSGGYVSPPSRGYVSPPPSGGGYVAPPPRPSGPGMVGPPPSRPSVAPPPPGPQHRPQEGGMVGPPPSR